MNQPVNAESIDHIDLLQKIADIFSMIKLKAPTSTPMQYTDQCIAILDTIVEIGFLPEDKIKDIYTSLLLAHTELLMLIEEGSDLYNALKSNRDIVVSILSIYGGSQTK